MEGWVVIDLEVPRLCICFDSSASFLASGRGPRIPVVLADPIASNCEGKCHSGAFILISRES